MRTVLCRPFVALAAAAALALSGCGQDAGDLAQAPAPTAAFPVTVSTDNGKVTIGERPKAIVSLAVSATEMMFAIGAGEQVKAVDKYSNFPPEAPTTDMSAFEPNIEAIIALEPDLVVLDRDRGRLREQLAAVSIPAMLLPPAENLADVYDQFEQLGQATGHTHEAAKVAADVRGQLRAIAASAPKPAEPLTYYHELTPEYYSATSGTFVGQVFGLLGMTSIADSAPGGTSENGGYPQLSAEYILKADPDFIFLADTVCCQQSPASLAKRPGWSDLSAVKNGTVVPLNDDVASRWGPRIVELLRAAANALAAATG